MPPIVVAVAAVAVSACGEQAGTTDAKRYSAELQPLNDSGVQGRASLAREGEHLTVTIEADGLAPRRIHGQAVHGFLGERRAADCAAQDSGDDGLIGWEEGASQYGPRLHRLEPFPTVQSDGRLDYRLTFNIDADRLEPLDTRTLVLRGDSADGKYRPDLPVACGRLSSVATAGVRGTGR